MRKKMLFLALTLTTAVLSLPVSRAEAGGSYYCPQCVTYSNGTQCCVSCWCSSSGGPIACTDNYCAPEGDF